ncbi:MAG: 50S ribosomal protein L19 [Armatimonadota bacterium]|nr:50S ribosomal protein L19 [Armatimonadota bacterium]
MTDLLRQIEEENMKQAVPEFQPGDSVRVGVRISEGSGEEQRVRVQPFEGVVIARDGSGLNETFTVRRVTHGVGVERVFPLHSPTVDSIEVLRPGSPRRAKLYYLRERVGRGARVRERIAREEIPAEAEEAAAEGDELAADVEEPADVEGPVADSQEPAPEAESEG